MAGDFNIAHEEIDLARPKQNKNNYSFRNFNPDPGHYAWWPYFANARIRNLGWREVIGVSRSANLPTLPAGRQTADQA